MSDVGGSAEKTTPFSAARELYKNGAKEPARRPRFRQHPQLKSPRNRSQSQSKRAGAQLGSRLAWKLQLSHPYRGRSKHRTDLLPLCSDPHTGQGESAGSKRQEAGTGLPLTLQPGRKLHVAGALRPPAGHLSFPR